MRTGEFERCQRQRQGTLKYDFLRASAVVFRLARGDLHNKNGGMKEKIFHVSVRNILHWAVCR